MGIPVTERWRFRLLNMRNRVGGAGIKVQYAYWLEGRMPHAPIEFKTLPPHVKDAFNCDEDGYLPPEADWKELARESGGWNSDGIYDVVDIMRHITKPL